jgi:hypothetical protein
MYEAIFPNLQNIPWGLILIAFGAGLFVAQKFRDKIPDIFTPAKPALTAEDVAKLIADALKAK